MLLYENNDLSDHLFCFKKTTKNKKAESLIRDLSVIYISVIYINVEILQKECQETDSPVIDKATNLVEGEIAATTYIFMNFDDEQSEGYVRKLLNVHPSPLSFRGTRNLERLVGK